MVLAVLLVSSHPEQSGTLIHSAVYGHALPVRFHRRKSRPWTLDSHLSPSLSLLLKVNPADEGEEEDTIVSSERSRLRDGLETVSTHPQQHRIATLITAVHLTRTPPLLAAQVASKVYSESEMKRTIDGPTKRFEFVRGRGSLSSLPCCSCLLAAHNSSPLPTSSRDLSASTDTGIFRLPEGSPFADVKKVMWLRAGR